jgi:hypothetical protein
MIKAARFLCVVRDDDIRQLLWVDEDGNHLVTSSTSEKGETRLRETMIFNANESGEIFDAEGIAVMHGIGNHGKVLHLAGYKPDWET